MSTIQKSTSLFNLIVGLSLTLIITFTLGLFNHTSLKGQAMPAINPNNNTHTDSLSPTVLQFRTAITKGSGVFITGQALTAADSAGMRLGDVNNDGFLDAIVVNIANQANNVWLNNGTGTFSAGTSFGSVSSRDVDLGDLDGDGDLDAFIANNLGQPNKVWKNNGNGTFTDSGQNLGSSDSYSVKLGDLDGDGDLDAFIANNDSTLENKVWLNQGGSQGGTAAEFSSNGQNLGNSLSWDVDLGDVDGDGDLDAFVANNGANKVWLNSSGIFTDSEQTLGSSNSIGLSLGDLDGDGDLDAFISNNGTANKIWFNDGGFQNGTLGNFSDSGQNLGNSDGRRVDLGDVDGDGDLDAFVANLNQGNKVWLNDGNGFFSDSGQSLGTSSSWGVDLGDLDNDGDLDAFIANYQQASRVWLNVIEVESLNPPPNSHTASLNTTLAVTFTNNISQNTVNSQTVVIHSSFQAPVAGTFNTASNNFSFNPTPTFYPGEHIQTTITNGLLDSYNVLSLPYVWQFRTTVLTGSGAFKDSGQSLSNLDSTGVDLGDLDGDGDLDAVVSNLGQVNRVWLNQGGTQSGTLGVFVNTQNFDNRSSTDLALGDLDGDGDLDVFVANAALEGDRVWLNDGLGSFSYAGQSLGAARSEAVALGDVDNDGDLDAFVSNHSGPNKVWLNNGSATFSLGQNLGNLNSRFVVLGDLDGDGDLDAFVNNTGQALKIWLNQGGIQGGTLGSFAVDTQDLGVTGGDALDLGDVDGDGDLDVFISHTGSTLSNKIWLNDGMGIFNDSGQAFDGGSRAIHLGDVDGDGDLDAFRGSSNEDNALWLNDGHGTFVDSEQPLDTAGALNSMDVALGDLDNDGDLDAFIANNSAPNTVWINQPYAYADLALQKTVTPQQVNPGDTVTYILTINNNGPNIASNAIITDVFPTSITVQSVISSNIIGLSQSNNGQTYTWETAFVAVSQPAIITITALVDVNIPIGIYTNTATITNTAVDSDTLNNSSAASLIVANNPVLLQALPIPNSHTAPITTPVSIEYSQPMSATTVSTQTFAIHAMQTGWLTQTYSVNGGIISLTPLNPFKPGELVQVSATTNTLSIDGLEPLASTVWQFNTAVLTGSGVFSDSVQTLGNSASASIALGDLDGDGDLDAFVGNRGFTGNNNEPNKVWLNDGGLQGGTPGVFIDSGQTLGNFSSMRVKLGDLDGDGDLDAFVPNYFGQANTVWLNDGGLQGGTPGVFIDSGQTLDSLPSVGVDLGDVDGDGDLDAFVTNYTTPDQVWLNNGTGGFVDSGQTLGGANSRGVHLGDLDGDGDLDAFVTNRPSGNGFNKVWLNEGGIQGGTLGIFVATAQSLGSSEDANLGDIDGDGDLDIFMANFGGNPNEVWLNDGTALFTNSGQSLGSSDSRFVNLGDLDGDGDLDAFVANLAEPNKVWLNDGNGIFVDSEQNFGGLESTYLSLGDLDDDGDLDAFVTNGVNVTQPNTVWLNQPLAYADLNLNKTVSPATANPGNTVTYTLTITNNGPNIASNAIITDVFPSNIAVQSVISSNIIAIQQSNTGNTYTWDTAFVAMSQPAIITVTAIVNTNVSTTTLTNVATVTNTAVDTDTTNNSSSVALTISPVSSVASTFIVNSNNNTNDGLCSTNHCSLIEAVEAANTIIGSTTPDQIHFNLPLDQETISPNAPLPTITDPVIISGTTQSSATCATPLVTLNGSNAGPNAIGLNLTAGNSTIHALNITNFISHGLSIDTNGNNRITCNSITTNGGDGVRVITSTQNLISANSIYTNTGLGIDLGGDGVTPLDLKDEDSGANNLQNAPVLIRSIPTTSGLTQTHIFSALKVQGYLHSAISTTFSIDFFSSPRCDNSIFGEGQVYLGTRTLETNGNGNIYFSETFTTTVLLNHKITATATDPQGNTSEFSHCSVVTWDNDAWPKAYPLSLNAHPTQTNAQYTTFEQVIDQGGQSRWFKLNIQPNNSLKITLNNLPVNYDLVLYKDIKLALKDQLTSQQDLLLHTAEAAPEAFLSDAFAPEAFLPEAFLPEAFLPEAFLPEAFLPEAFLPEAFLPEAFLPEAFLPDAFFPEAFLPEAFLPEAFLPEAFLPEAFLSEAFDNAQMHSLVAVSMLNGPSAEEIELKTWNNTGDFYIRVSSREGTYDVEKPFTLQVTRTNNECPNISAEDLPPSNIQIETGPYKSLILTNLNRLPGSDTELQTHLSSLAARNEVNGVIVDISQETRVMEAISLSEQYPYCPYLKNLAAEAIKNIINQYWAENPLEYIVIVGNDDVIPFFRYPDQALLANESGYNPPVLDNTASQASLKLGYVLSDNGYSSKINLSQGLEIVPIPDLAVGRLVETPSDIIPLLNAYLTQTTNGVVTTPTTALVTGYDFIDDVATAVADELTSGLGTEIDRTLIVSSTISPEDPRSWTGDDLKAKLLNNRYDIAFLAGHFSAASLLAADYNTRVLSTDILTSTIDMTNAIFFTIGCHSGYNIVNEHGIENITREPDWAELFSQKGATLIGGTGYQYGDTEFIQYSERLYLLFSQQLRKGTGPVSIGKALVESKQAYLYTTASLRGIDQKSLLEATLYGLPMLKIDLPYGREKAKTAQKTSIVTNTTPFATNPGYSLNLTYADVQLDISVTQAELALNTISSPNQGNSQTFTSTYFYYQDPIEGISVNPMEPVLPLARYNVEITNTVLRGVAFKGGTYTELEDIIPLTGAPATEIRGVHTSFNSRAFYPSRPWNINYMEALAEENGSTYLMLLPAQYKSSAINAITGTWRTYQSMDFRLYYSNNITNTEAAVSAPPTISRVDSFTDTNSITFRVQVHGKLAASIQEVWVTYTAVDGPLLGHWQSINLTQNQTQSTWWEATLNLEGTLAGTQAKDIRYIVQAVNGVGLVSMKTNRGLYYIPNQTPESSNPNKATTLTLNSTPSSGDYSDKITVVAQLNSQTNALSNQWLNFSLGSQRQQIKTDANGVATATIALLDVPGTYQVGVTFIGDEEYLPNAINTPFSINKKATQLKMEYLPNPLPLSSNKLLVATLTTTNSQSLKQTSNRQTSQQLDEIPLREKIVFVQISSPESTEELTTITNYKGQVNLNQLVRDSGTYTIALYFGSQVTGTTTISNITFNLEDRYYKASLANGQFSVVANAIYLPIILKQ